MSLPPPKPQDYHVGWICAVQTEYVVACEFLDEEHPPLPISSLHDNNTYTFGRIGHHNVVIACLPKGKYGLTSATSVAKDMLRSFPSIRFGMMVGIGGGAPSLKHDIRLGDVVVSSPVGRTGGVIHYEFGKTIQNQKFERTGALDAPPAMLLTALSGIGARHERKGHRIAESVNRMVAQNPRLRKKYRRPEPMLDQLYNSSFIHPDRDLACDKVCSSETSQLIKRNERPTDEDDPIIHYGLIASADQLMEDAQIRDTLARDEEVLCFEMEAAGFMDYFPCVVIRGICDYSDTHKNDIWQGYAAATAAAYAKELLDIIPVVELSSMPTAEGPDSAQGNSRVSSSIVSDANKTRWDIETRVSAARANDTKETFSVSFSLSEVSETENFVGREEELAQIHEKLQSRGSRTTVILQGLGGMGKTQLAVTYAKRHRDLYSAIFWLNAKDEDTLKQSFGNIAKRIHQNHLSLTYLDNAAESGDLDKAVDGVKRWLNGSGNNRWLLIFDNYDNPKLAGSKDPGAFDIRLFLPETHQGAIIITTRSSQVKIGHLIPIRKLQNVQQGLEILCHTSGRHGLHNDIDAHELARELDGLPLALATAGAYLDQVSTSFAEYLRLYKESWLKLQRTTPQLLSYEDRALYSTWALSLDHVKHQNGLSAKLLQLWAYFDNQDLWFELLQSFSGNRPKWFSDLTEDELSFNKAVRVLCDHALVEPDIVSESSRTESRGYSMHGCVHSWTIHVLNREWNFEMAGLAVNCVGLHVPDNQSRGYWILQQRLIRHANRCLYLITNRLDVWDENLSMPDSMNWLGDLYEDQGKLDEAEEMYRRALEGYEKALGAEHTSTLTTVNNLGIIYRNQGKLEEAEKMYRRALEGYEKALGTEHTSTLDTVNNLGLLYSDQGKLDEAEKMYRRALEGTEKALGTEHTSTLGTVNNLGILYRNQGKLDEAEKMYRRALEGKEKALGTEHTSTLGTVDNLGVLYRNQGKLEEAEKMYRRALEGYEKALGVENAANYLPALNTVQNIGDLYRDQGKVFEAEKMYSRALVGSQTIFGLDHRRCRELNQKISALKRDE